MLRTSLVFAAAVSLALGWQGAAWGQQGQAGRSVGGTSGSGTSGRTNFSSSSSSSSLGRTGSSSFGSGMGSSTGLGGSTTSNLQLGSAAQQMLREATQAGHFVGGDLPVAGFAGYGATSTTSRGTSYGYGTSPYGYSSYGSSAYRSSGYGQGMYGNRRSSANRYYSQYGMSNSMSLQEVRAALAVGFDRAPAVATETSSRVAARLQKAATRIQFRSAPQVSVQSGTAILRGVVATEHDRVLAEQLARLEPGISRVQNELTLPPPASPSPAPGSPSSTARPPAVPSPPAAAK